MKSSLKTNTKNCSQFLLIKNHGEKALGYVQIIFLCQHVFVTSEWSVEKEKKLCRRRGREKALKNAQAQNGKSGKQKFMKTTEKASEREREKTSEKIQHTILRRFSI
jgi:hypothetical protein